MPLICTSPVTSVTPLSYFRIMFHWVKDCSISQANDSKTKLQCVNDCSFTHLHPLCWCYFMILVCTEMQMHLYWEKESIMHPLSVPICFYEWTAASMDTVNVLSGSNRWLYLLRVARVCVCVCVCCACIGVPVSFICAKHLKLYSGGVLSYHATFTSSGWNEHSLGVFTSALSVIKHYFPLAATKFILYV